MDSTLLWSSLQSTKHQRSRFLPIALTLNTLSVVFLITVVFGIKDQEVVGFVAMREGVEVFCVRLQGYE